MSQTVPATPPTPAPSNATVVSKAVVRAARFLGLNNSALAGVLGLSEATISRLASGAYTLDPGSKAYELALLLIRLFRGLDAIVGGEQVPMRGWMRSPNLDLGGIPAEQVRSIAGLTNAVAYVDSVRARL